MVVRLVIIPANIQKIKKNLTNLDLSSESDYNNNSSDFDDSSDDGSDNGSDSESGYIVNITHLKKKK